MTSRFNTDMDSAGLGARFAPTPRQSFGATANDATGVGSAMGNTFPFSSPTVSNVHERARFQAHNRTLLNPQGRRSFNAHQTAAPLPFLGTPLPSWGGRQRHIVSDDNWLSVTAPVARAEVDKIPRPCPSLMARLAISNVALANQHANRRSDMKSVDRTSKQFLRRYGALPSEDWIMHIDLLETERAYKHQWTPREFYYGLRVTLVGKAFEALKALEHDHDRPPLARLIPDWFEPDTAEWRGISTGMLSFQMLSPRTKVATLIVLFYSRYQRSSPDTAYLNFKYAAQSSHESVEEWGIRLHKLIMRLRKYGGQVSWPEYLEQWRSGTKDGAFAAKLQEALVPDDPRKQPLVVDFPSFRSWYHRYLEKILDKKRNLARRSRLLIFHNHSKVN